MIGTACFYILPVVGDRTFFKNVLIFFTPAGNSIVSLIS